MFNVIEWSPWISMPDADMSIRHVMITFAGIHQTYILTQRSNEPDILDFNVLDNSYRVDFIFREVKYLGPIKRKIKRDLPDWF